MVGADTDLTEKCLYLNKCNVDKKGNDAKKQKTKTLPKSDLQKKLFNWFKTIRDTECLSGLPSSNDFGVRLNQDDE